MSGRHSLSNSIAINDSQGQPFRLGYDKSTVDYTGDFGETKTFKFDKVMEICVDNLLSMRTIVDCIPFCKSCYENIILFICIFIQVFDGTTTQEDVFEEVKGVVDSVMSGFNGTVMAYGQTSAGMYFRSTIALI